MIKKILSVDDQGDIRRLIRMTLEFQGHTVLEAFSADSGLQIARRERPDLILLDVKMPGGLSGIELCKIIANDPELSAIPVILLTSADDKTSKSEGLEAGAKIYLTKPFNPLELLELVDAHAR